jgi:diphthamide synthase (EF-2-diphthine--ammonia ligase)
MPSTGVAVSFTGGKDSVLALHLYAGYGHELIPTPALRTNPDENHTIGLLVTFVPAPGPDGTIKGFKAHPLEFIRAQAASLGVPHVNCTVNAPFLESYRDQIQQLRTQHGITTLVTGDILDVSQGFMRQAVKGTGVELATPLWQLPRVDILQAMFDLNIRSVVSCINLQKFSREQGEPASAMHAKSGAQLHSDDLQRQEPGATISASGLTVRAEGEAGCLIQTEKPGAQLLAPEPFCQIAGPPSCSSRNPSSAEKGPAASDTSQPTAACVKAGQQQHESTIIIGGPTSAASEPCTEHTGSRMNTIRGERAEGLDTISKPEFSGIEKFDAMRDVLGAELDSSLVAGPLSFAHQAYGVDLCGEGGEYHTLVFDAPLFKSRVAWDAEKMSTGSGADDCASGTAAGSPYAWLALSNIHLC